MIKKILKLGGFKNEADFYKKYPTEESFMLEHGDKLKNMYGTGGYMPKKYNKKSQEILSLDFPYFGTAYANYGTFGVGGYLNNQSVTSKDIPTEQTLGSTRTTELSDSNSLDSNSLDSKGLNYLGQVGNMAGNFINQQTTDPRGIQTQEAAGLAGGVRGGINGAKTGFELGNMIPIPGAGLIGAGVGLAVGAGIGVYSETKQNKVQNQVAKDNLINYYTGLPDATMTSANPYKNMSANGGFLANGGQMNDTYNEYEGNSHENGGLPVGQNNEVEGGEVNYKFITSKGFIDYVFSDRLTPEGKKSTFATQAKKIRNKYKEREYDAAANRAMEQELTGLMQQNEQARIIKEAQDKHQQELEGIKQQFANGGYMKNKLAPGGPLKPVGIGLDPYQDNSFTDYNSGAGSLPEYLKQSYVNNLIAQQSQQVLPQNNPNPNSYIPNINNAVTQGALNQQGLNYAMKGVNDSLPKNTQQKEKFKWGNEETALGLSMLPALYNNIKGLKPTKTVFDKATPSLVNLEAERYALKNEGAKARLIAGENVRNQGMGSGSSLAALAAQHSAISSNVMQGLSQSYQNEATANTGIKNNFSQYNNNIRNEEIIANEQNQAMADSLKSLGLSDLSNNGQGYLRDKSLTKENIRSNKEKTDLINQLFTNYKFGTNPETDAMYIQFISSGGLSAGSSYGNKSETTVTQSTNYKGQQSTSKKN